MMNNGLCQNGAAILKETVFLLRENGKMSVAVANKSAILLTRRNPEIAASIFDKCRADANTFSESDFLGVIVPGLSGAFPAQ